MKNIHEIVDKLDKIHNLLSKSDITTNYYQPISELLIDVKKEIRENIKVEHGLQKYHPAHPITATDASTRLINALKAYVGVSIGSGGISHGLHGVPPLYDLELKTLSKFTERQLLRIRNLGQNSVNQLITILSHAGLKLKN